MTKTATTRKKNSKATGESRRGIDQTKKSVKNASNDDVVGSSPASDIPLVGGPLAAEKWSRLREEIRSSSRRTPARTLFDCENTNPYLYGVAIASGRPVNDWRCELARLAIGDVGTSVSPPMVELIRDQAITFVESVSDDSDSSTPIDAILWATAIGPLADALPQKLWWELLSKLQDIRADAALRSDFNSAEHLWMAGELGITLAWRLSVLPSCEQICQSSINAITAFIDGEADSIDEVLKRPEQLRCVVASLIRCNALFPAVGSSHLKKRHREIVAEFATWMAALTRRDGSQVLSDVTATDAKIDAKIDGACGVRIRDKDEHKSSNAKKKKKIRDSAKQRSEDANRSPDLLSGLMRAASQFDPDTLVPATAAALGQSHSGGRLAWEVSLPEAMWHSETGKLVAMLPEWDVRRGRSFLDYCGEDIRIEIMGGGSTLFSGVHQTMISVDGESAHPQGDWETTCEYSDDDVHLIEFEQPFTHGVVLQRQWMVIREDRCVMVSDAILPSSDREEIDDKKPLDAPELVCVSRLPLAGGVDVVSDELTNELLLRTGSKKRAMVLPLAANEWRVGPSNCRVSISDDQHLVVQTRGCGALYSPVWLDLQPRRFRRPRTWRPLTIAENLGIVPKSVATGFRVQFGSEHWVIYRSMSDSQPIAGPRSFMGKHLIADFLAARFHPGDGGIEELVTVDDRD